MSDKPVTIYTTKTCGFCRATKEFFAANNVGYQEIDVGSDQAKAREMIEKSGQMGVPVTVIGEGESEEIIVGFDKARLAASLGINA
jgi:glutaredoxin-like YruB-family protein